MAPWGLLPQKRASHWRLGACKQNAGFNPVSENGNFDGEGGEMETTNRNLWLSPEHQAFPKSSFITFPTEPGRRRKLK